jgi:hypothetical protein
VKERSATGWLLSLVGGALIAILGVFVISSGFATLFAPAPGTATDLVNEGMVLTATGLLILIGSVAFYTIPDQRRNWAALVFALSALAWVESAAFVASQNVVDLALSVSIGPVLGFVGGILGIVGTPAD